MCGYYGLYFLRECDRGRDFYDIVKVFDTRNKRGNYATLLNLLYGLYDKPTTAGKSSEVAATPVAGAKREKGDRGLKM